MKNVYALLLSLCLSVISFNTAIASDQNGPGEEQSMPQQRTVPDCPEWLIEKEFDSTDAVKFHYRGAIKPESENHHIARIVFSAARNSDNKIEIHTTGEYNDDIKSALNSYFPTQSSWTPFLFNTCGRVVKTDEAWFYYSDKGYEDIFLALFKEKGLMPDGAVKFITDYLNRGI